MATAPAAARLTEAHRLAQARLGARTVTAVRSSWAALNPAEVDATTRRWLQVAVPIVRAHRADSAQLATTYLRAFRRLEVPDAPRLTPVVAADLDLRQAVVSLTVTGPYKLKSASARGLSPVAASNLARDDAARAAMRLTLNGGRQTIVGTVAEDPKALGWARATSGSACAFCAALASRGPVYRDDTADFEAHDHCACTAEPVYHRDADWPSGSREYRDLWDQVAKSDTDPLNAFRRALTAS